jgi:hypothetical protein
MLLIKSSLRVVNISMFEVSFMINSARSDSIPSKAL